MVCACQGANPYLSQQVNKSEGHEFTKEQLIVIAKQGDARTQLELGKELCCGNGLEQDNQLGYTFICEAAKKGIPEAQYHLGLLHQQGVSFSLSPYTLDPFLLPKDKVTSYMWFSIAATNGHEEAKSMREELHEEMNFTELNRAISQRKFWKRKSCNSFGTIELFSDFPKKD